MSIFVALAVWFVAYLWLDHRASKTIKASLDLMMGVIPVLAWIALGVLAYESFAHGNTTMFVLAVLFFGILSGLVFFGWPDDRFEARRRVLKVVAELASDDPAKSATDSLMRKVLRAFSISVGSLAIGVCGIAAGYALAFVDITLGYVLTVVFVALMIWNLKCSKKSGRSSSRRQGEELARSLQRASTDGRPRLRTRIGRIGPSNVGTRPALDTKHASAIQTIR